MFRAFPFPLALAISVTFIAAYPTPQQSRDLSTRQTPATPAETTTTTEDGGVVSSIKSYYDQSSDTGKKGLLALLALIPIGLGVWWFMRRRKKNKKKKEDEHNKAVKAARDQGADAQKIEAKMLQAKRFQELVSGGY